MSITDSQQLSEVLQRVSMWSTEKRRALAQGILESLEGPPISHPAKTMGLEDVIGLLKTANPPPDDEACQQIVEDERSRKYG